MSPPPWLTLNGVRGGGGWQPGCHPGLWRTLSPSSALASCLWDAAWLLWSSSFPSCLLLMLTTPASPGTGRNKLSDHLCLQAQVNPILSAFAHSSGASLEVQDFRLFTENHVRCRKCCDLPPVIFPDTSFTSTLRSWGPGKNVSASPFLFVSNLSEVCTHHAPSTPTSSGMVWKELLHNWAPELWHCLPTLPPFSGNRCNQPRILVSPSRVMWNLTFMHHEFSIQWLLNYIADSLLLSKSPALIEQSFHFQD